jgi:predicted metal-dependent enzyme (double-stranded beta helix superfamily)
MLLSAMAVSTQLIFSPRSNAEAKPMRNTENGTMNIDHFVEDCIAANRETDAQAAVKEVLARAVSNPKAVLASIGEPEKAGINVLHTSATLTIFSATWTPQMNLMPHNHLMWANIGIYTGREDNIMWRRNAENIEAFEAAALFEGDTAALPVDAIHSVTNPLLRFTGGIHIYGGDFFDTTRSQWDPETLGEEPSDGAVIRAMFDRENERWQQMTDSG